jgi:hypothetical protein
LIEAKTLAMLGLLFPELPGATRWLQTGLRILWTQVRRQFHPDGVHTEQATQYHTLCTGELWEILNLLRRNSLSIPSDILDRFEAAVDFQTTIVKPDGHIPLFGDSVRHDLHRRFDPRWASLWLGKGRPFAGSLDEETSWLLGTMTCSDAAAPAPTSRAFPHGGYVVMRDNATYLALDCGPFGDEMVPSHGHADALSLEVCVLDQTLLTDSGGFSYHASPIWRDYFRGTRAHNTIVVDGADQSQLVGRREVSHRAQARLIDWICTPSADWAVAEHDGYTRLPDPVIHRRRVLFIGKGSKLRPSYWLVVDSLMGAVPHQAEWHFHLHPDVDWLLEPNTNSLQATVGQVALKIALAPSDSLTTKIVTGQESPPLGWVSFESGQKKPAPTLVLSQQGDLPTHLPIVLYPFETGRSMPVDVRILELDEDTLAVTITTPETNDLVAVSLGDTAATLCLQSLRTVARALVLRQSDRHEPSAYALGAKTVEEGNRQVCSDTISWISLTQKDKRWTITGRG